ncbi:flavodoxin I [Cetobacterium ceti]|uniref:Flavodoxin n=1 Tax=Cetobacterium ceti TaxID=180163 RepID=A0A1T4N8A8_9FUSO|nr:flavodoxin [Cetobacterium ceti]SJZ75336.1 flavodoxin I [Cetobacterium ceti]
MEKIGVFYGTTGGRTEAVVKKLQNFFPNNECEFFDVAKGISEIKNFNNIILATPSYGAGEVQDDWAGNLSDLESLDLSDKTFALIGVGDQYSFGAFYVGGLRELYNILENKEAHVVGFTENSGYEFDDSPAIKDNKFVGLVIDDSFTCDEVLKRMSAWVQEIKKEFK